MAQAATKSRGQEDFFIVQSVPGCQYYLRLISLVGGDVNSLLRAAILEADLAAPGQCVYLHSAQLHHPHAVVPRVGHV
eukprot:7478209-Pyramimonas_sp.AAC.1